jgi:hypothetical protein
MRTGVWMTMMLAVVVSAGVAGDTTSIGGAAARPYFSSRQTSHPGKALQGYVRNLQSTNDGVVESSIAHIAFMVMIFPDIDRAATLEILERLSLNGSTPEIRYKAYLANLVAGNPRTFSVVLDSNYVDTNQFFLAISQRAQASLLARDNPR